MKISQAFEKYWEKNIRDPDELLGYIADGRIKLVNKGLDESQVSALFIAPIPKHESKEIPVPAALLEKSLEQLINEKRESLSKLVGIFSNPAGVLSESMGFLKFLKDCVSDVTVSMHILSGCADAADHFYTNNMFSESSRIRKEIIELCYAKKKDYEQKGQNGYHVQKLDKIIAYSYSMLADAYHGLAGKNTHLPEQNTRLLELAHNSLENSIKLFENFGPDAMSKADKFVKLGFSYAHLGHVHRKLRRYVDSKRAFKQAIDYLGQVPEPSEAVKSKLAKTEDSLRRLSEKQSSPKRRRYMR